MTTLKMYVTGDSVSGNGKKNVILQLSNDVPQEDGVSTNDTIQFSLDPSHPDFDAFVKNKDVIHTITID